MSMHYACILPFPGLCLPASQLPSCLSVLRSKRLCRGRSRRLGSASPSHSGSSVLWHPGTLALWHSGSEAANGRGSGRESQRARQAEWVAPVSQSPPDRTAGVAAAGSEPGCLPGRGGGRWAASAWARNGWRAAPWLPFGFAVRFWRRTSAIGIPRKALGPGLIIV